jgi:hypothetical protein
MIIWDDEEKERWDLRRVRERTVTVKLAACMQAHLEANNSQTTLFHSLAIFNPQSLAQPQNGDGGSGAATNPLPDLALASFNLASSVTSTTSSSSPRPAHPVRTICGRAGVFFSHR